MARKFSPLTAEETSRDLSVRTVPRTAVSPCPPHVPTAPRTAVSPCPPYVPTAPRTAVSPCPPYVPTKPRTAVSPCPPHVPTAPQNPVSPLSPCPPYVPTKPRTPVSPIYLMSPLHLEPHIHDETKRTKIRSRRGDLRHRGGVGCHRAAESGRNTSGNPINQRDFRI
uniref:Uncharacterized protein n=1 Tax=Scleropages formosus TaxID=113540 RepID=A0A8D0CKF0_SCLFO